jgi:DNA-binding NarL/FixJ family response regulator
VRVLLATDRPSLGEALSLFLAEAHIEVVATAADSGALVALAAVTRPDVILVDWQLAGAGSAGAVAELKSRGEPAPIVLLSTPEEGALASMAEADDHVTLGDHPENLVKALREAVAARR